MFTDEKLIYRNIKSNDKSELLKSFCQKLEGAGVVTSTTEFFQAIWEREENFSTGIGRNVAIPHGKSASVKETKLLLAIIPEGVEYDSLDGQLVKILFMFAVPLGKDKEYMGLLAKVTSFVREEKNRNKLLEASSEQELLKLIREVINE